MGSEQRRKQPGPHGAMSAFLKAVLWTAIPILALNAISSGVMWGQGMNSIVGGWFATAGLVAWVLSILACIVLAIARKRQTASGVLVGAAIGILGLGATCFTVMMTQTSGA